MQTNLLWTGREYQSLENCLVNTSSAGAEITSTIIGYSENKIYKTEYCIKTNHNWETVFFEISSRHSNKFRVARLESDGKGNWSTSGKRVDQFEGCIDIDISLTPFTNSLPIKRLKLAQDESQEIQVIYLDVLTQQMRSVWQRYIRLSDSLYHYQNIPNDFEANIQVDELGLVVDYPSLFVRTAAMETNFPAH